MSGPTKAEFEIQLQEIRSKAAVLDKVNMDLRIQRDKLITEAQDERRRGEHCRAQRDQLLGYIEGSRVQEPIEVDNGPGYVQNAPIKILPLDVFLDRMRSDS